MLYKHLNVKLWFVAFWIEGLGIGRPYITQVCHECTLTFVYVY